MLAQPNPQAYLDTALSALAADADWRSVLDELPVPIYTTDADGAVSYWNRACADFAGREPDSEDRWCVAWQLYTATGERLPYADCPMAQALKEKRPIRDVIAIAERPDGSRVAFRPYPTPLFDESGSLTGAINLMIDVTDEQSEALHEQAERCRRLADALYSRESNVVLEQMAERFEQTAAELKQKRSG
jgi:PAS domain S-box-containing protein